MPVVSDFAVALATNQPGIESQNLAQLAWSGRPTIVREFNAGGRHLASGHQWAYMVLTLFAPDLSDVPKARLFLQRDYQVVQVAINGSDFGGGLKVRVHRDYQPSARRYPIGAVFHLYRLMFRAHLIADGQNLLEITPVLDNPYDYAIVWDVVCNYHQRA